MQMQGEFRQNGLFRFVGIVLRCRGVLRSTLQFARVNCFFRGSLHLASYGRLCSNFSRLSHAALVNRQNPSADGLSYGSSVHVMQLIGATCSLTWASFLLLFPLAVAALSMFTSGVSVLNYSTSAFGQQVWSKFY